MKIWNDKEFFEAGRIFVGACQFCQQFVFFLEFEFACLFSYDTGLITSKIKNENKKKNNVRVLVKSTNLIYPSTNQMAAKCRMTNYIA